MLSRRLFVAVLLWAGVHCSVVATEPEPAFKVTTPKDTDEVKISADKERTYFDVTSKTGIGGAKIQRTGKEWPQQLRLRLDLAGLENFHISNGKLGLSAAILSHGEDRTASLRGSDGKAVAPGGRLWTEVRMIGRDGKPTKTIPLDGRFEMDLPKGLFEGNPESIELSWIDFYR